MTGTLINESNSDYFLPVIPTDILVSSDMFIGVIDDEYGTACGVLAAEASEGHTLLIRYIYVAEEFRNKGAGEKLVMTFLEAAQEMEAEYILCTHSRGNESDGIEELLSRCGFVKDHEQTMPIFGVYPKELTLKKKNEKAANIVILPLGKIDDKMWQIGGINWKNEKGPINGLNALLYKKEKYDERLSFAAFDTKEDLIGMLLVSKGEKAYEVEALSARGKDAPHVLYALIEKAIAVSAKEIGDKLVMLRPETPQHLELFKRVTEGAYITLGETAVFTFDLSGEEI